VSVNTEEAETNDAELFEWASRFVGLVFAIVPIEEANAASPESVAGLPEGALSRIEVNRYERSRLNRAACIELQGSRCLACDFSFRDAYGEIGDGFIQVHHVTPISRIGLNYIVDPLTDLVPLCSNCHSIAHRRDPALSVQEIRALLAGQDAGSDCTN
jgi:5-methylcytosine-specific restriction protein A